MNNSHENVRECQLKAGTYFIGGRTGTTSLRCAVAISDVAKAAFRRRLIHGDPVIVEYFPFQDMDGMSDDQILGIPLTESVSIATIEAELLQMTE